MEQKAIQAIIAAALLLAGAIVGGSLNQNKPIYQCESKNLLSNCEKLGANATRCYYNATAPTKYATCSAGWVLLSAGAINPENSALNGVLIKDIKQIQYICTSEGCELWQ
jgi:hypothetical protein